jgi:hypothetical protein
VSCPVTAHATARARRVERHAARGDPQPGGGDVQGASARAPTRRPGPARAFTARGPVNG